MNRARWVVGVVLGAIVLGLAAACASGGQGRLPLSDPGDVASRLRLESGAEAPTRIRFRWQYGDKSGRISGDGVARINPPDSFRLDLFTAGEGSMAVVLANSRLSTLGEIEDVELPDPPFMYAMAGLFRPGASAFSEGYRSDTGFVLVYEMATGHRRLFYWQSDRLVRIEERAGSRVTQRVRLTWGEKGAWPREAEYRDLVEPRRVRWTLEANTTTENTFPREVYELGASQ